MPINPPTLIGAGHASARDSYRMAWRKMATNTNERIAHFSANSSGGVSYRWHRGPRPSDGSLSDLVRAQASASTLLSDFVVRASPKNNLWYDAIASGPLAPETTH